MAAADVERSVESTTETVLNKLDGISSKRKNKQLHLKLLLIRKMCLPYFRQNLVKV